MIAALFVEKDGVYSGLPDVDVWDESRDARLYAGPWSVVAHPPCARWCAIAALVEARYGYQRGDDGGCFEAALAAVREYGGVLEHPAFTKAWSHFGLPRPTTRGGWTTAIGDDGLVTEIDQHVYGHPARKSTWLYYVGDHPLAVCWTRAPAGLPLVSSFSYNRGARWHTERMRVRPAVAIRTPEPFRDVLLALAATASRNPRPPSPARRDLTPEPDPAHPRNREPKRNSLEAAGVDGLTTLEEEDAPKR